MGDASDGVGESVRIGVDGWLGGRCCGCCGIRGDGNVDGGFVGVGTGVFIVGDERTDSMLIIAICNKDVLGRRKCEAAAW